MKYLFCKKNDILCFISICMQSTNRNKTLQGVTTLFVNFTLFAYVSIFKYSYHGSFFGYILYLIIFVSLLLLKDKKYNYVGKLKNKYIH